MLAPPVPISAHQRCIALSAPSAAWICRRSWAATVAVMLTLTPIFPGVTVASGASVVGSWFRFQPSIAPLEPSATPATVPAGANRPVRDAFEVGGRDRAAGAEGRGPREALPGTRGEVARGRTFRRAAAGTAAACCGRAATRRWYATSRGCPALARSARRATLARGARRPPWPGVPACRPGPGCWGTARHPGRGRVPPVARGTGSTAARALATPAGALVGRTQPRCPRDRPQPHRKL